MANTEPRKLMTAEEDAKVSAMRTEGAGIKAIAQELGRNPSVINRAVARLGLRAGRLAKPMKAKRPPKLGQRRLSKESIERIAVAQRARWARVHAARDRGEITGVLRRVSLGRVNGKGHIPTSEVRARKGQYHCPECGRGFPALRHLGRHRSTHGVAAASKSNLAAKARRAKTTDVIFRQEDGTYHCPECDSPFGSPSGINYHLVHTHNVHRRYKFRSLKPTNLEGETIHGNGHQPATQPSSPHRKTNKGEWTSEGIAGFLFAHVQSLIERACTGREGAISDVTLRLSTLLHFEVSRESQRQRHLGMLHSLSGMRGETGS